MNKRILVVVATYNGSKWVDKCFGSLKRSTIPLSIIAIDNNSDDDTVYLIKAMYPEVEIVESKDNLGFGKANNIGLNKAIKEEFEYVFLLNQDAWIEKNTVENLLVAYSENKSFGILSPIHLEGTGRRMDREFSNFLTNTPNILSDFVLNDVKQIYETSFVNAAAWFIPQESLLKTGGFDPIFPHYGEDNDYANRVIYNGFKIGVVPSARVCHDRNQNPSPTKKYDLKRIFIKDLLKVKRIEGNYLYFLLLFCKRKLCLISDYLYLRQTKLAKVHFLSFLKILKQSSNINRSIALSKKERPFL